jgi:hypothetical protein
VDASSGLVTAVAPGTANITATSEGVSGSAEVTVTAPPPPGTLQIQVSGLLAAAPDGGSASVLRTDITGQTPQSVTVPLSGTVEVSGQPGTYYVTYTPPSGYQLSDSVARTATVVSSQTASVTFQVTELGAEPVGVIFHSDWSTALDTSRYAVLDSGKTVPWDVAGGAGFQVIASTGLDFPTDNVLQLTALQDNLGFALVRKYTLPEMAVGQSRYYRWYSRVVIPDGAAPSDDETHPHQDGNSSNDSNWLMHLFHDGLPGSGANQWTPQISTQTDNFHGPSLDKNTTYRFEFKYTRTGTNTLTMDIRVYNSAGTLLYTGNDFRGEFGADSHAALNSVTHAVSNVASLGQINAGLNGLDGEEWFPSLLYMYQGGLAISDTDWLGPYRGGK